MLPTRLRKNRAVRCLVRETVLTMNDVIYPLFVVEGTGIKREIESLKGQYHLSCDMLADEMRELSACGVKAVILFGVPDHKDGYASSAYSDEGIVQRAVKAIKASAPEMYVIADVCLCEYKSDGHCCFFESDGQIDRKRTISTLSRISVSLAKAGVDMIAPSDMMDGRIEEIRKALDAAGYESVPIMSYAAKFASSFYGPFRDAAGSAPAFGDRRSYQMDPANADEALREIDLDVEEGADIIMVKPASAYLDILAKAKERTVMPLAAYQVSGEYAMLRNAVDLGLMDERVLFESLVCIKRAGANLIITYFAKDVKHLIESYQEA